MTPDSKKDSKNVRCITKPGLMRVNDSSIGVGYNRTLDPVAVATLPEDTIYVVTPMMVHEHIAGKIAEPHMRCSIYAGLEHPWMMLDMSFEYFNQLPRVSELAGLPDNVRKDEEKAIRAEVTKAAAAMQEKQTAEADEEKHDE